jgi:hypothetical protein
MSRSQLVNTATYQNMEAGEYLAGVARMVAKLDAIVTA